jgi:hypothetical protein
MEFHVAWDLKLEPSCSLLTTTECVLLNHPLLSVAFIQWNLVQLSISQSIHEASELHSGLCRSHIPRQLDVHSPSWECPLAIPDWSGEANGFGNYDVHWTCIWIEMRANYAEKTVHLSSMHMIVFKPGWSKRAKSNKKECLCLDAIIGWMPLPADNRKVEGISKNDSRKTRIDSAHERVCGSESLFNTLGRIHEMSGRVEEMQQWERMQSIPIQNTFDDNPFRQT